MCFSFFTAVVFFAHVEGHVCEDGREIDATGTWKWVLSHPDPCRCTEVKMGGTNTWTPTRPYKSIYANSPLISDDFERIREHYILKNEEKGMKILL